MENRYLFHAKRVDNGEWVEGSLVTGVFFRLGQEIPYMFCPNLADYDCFEDFSEENGIFEVEPSTICQCTGLRDKNGKLIYEDDIAKDDKGNLYKAFWQDNHYQFSWMCVKSEKLPIGAKWNFDCFREYEMEVIGNVFDNPELLEGGKELV